MFDTVSLLNWIVYSGGALVLSSWVLDRIPQFAALSADVKRAVNFGAAIGLALAVYAALLYTPPAVIAAIDPWLKIVLGFVGLYTGQQVIHKTTKVE